MPPDKKTLLSVEEIRFSKMENCTIFLHFHNSFVGTGSFNPIIGADTSAIVTGSENTIGSTLGPAGYCYATGSFIGGGYQNCIDTGNSAGLDSLFGMIGGGQNNKICAGSCYSSIIGGQNNTVCHKWATVSGYNVTSQADCAFTTNRVVACNTPLFGGPAPTGMLQFFPATPGLVAAGIPLGACLVFIQ